MNIFLNDSIFEASSPTRHRSELGRVMKKMFPDAFAVILYTDGGPDDNCKHISVRLGLLALFMELNLDTMVVMRTAPTQSWANPVERVMSVLNLGLQGVALARDTMPDEYEKDFKKCLGMTDVRNAAKAHEIIEVGLDPDAEHDEMLQVLAQRQHKEDEEMLLLSQEEEDRPLFDENEQQRLEDEFQMELLDDEQMEEHHQQHQPVRHGALEVDMTGWDEDDDVRSCSSQCPCTTSLTGY